MSILIDKLDCGFCDGKAILRSRPQVVNEKEFVHYYYKCTSCYEEFTTTESDTESLKNYYDKK
jgi:DNA-directed RNA polymerase subunit RPC12/RpoP